MYDTSIKSSKYWIPDMKARKSCLSVNRNAKWWWYGKLGWEKPVPYFRSVGTIEKAGGWRARSGREKGEKRDQKWLSHKCSTTRPQQLGITMTIIKLWYKWNKDSVQFVSNNLTSCCISTLMFSSSHKTDKYVRKLTDCQHRWAAS